MRAFILIVAVVIIGGGAYWFWGPTAGDDSEVEVDQTVTSNPADSQGGADQATDGDTSISADAQVITNTSDLEALFASGDSIRCEYESSVDGVANVGTVNFDPSIEGYRVTGATTIEGEVHETNMIMQDETLYTWGSSPMGQVAFMMPVPEDSGPSDLLEGNMEMPSTADDVPPDDRSVRYECVTTNLDAALFELPEDIEFTSMGGMMPAGGM